MEPRVGMTDRQAWGVLAAVLGLYLLGDAAFPAPVPSVRDEVKYLEQAQAIAGGSNCYEEEDPLTGASRCNRPATYLPGTAAFLAPFVLAGGWRAAYVVPALCVLGTVVLAGLWLRSRGRSPLWALLVLGYPPTLVFGRIAMSDAPSQFLAALGLWLFFTGGSERAGRWLAAGFVAGLSLSVRETNVLVFLPLFVGAVFRQRFEVWPLVVGGLAATALRPLSTWWVFGDPFFVFPHGPSFALANIPANLPIYAVALLLYLPAGLIGALAYRGERRPEIVATVVLVLGVYLSYGYSGGSSGLLKQLLLGPRYFMPLAPLVAFACAESFPRLWSGWVARRASPRTWSHLARFAVLGWVSAIAILAFAVHPTHAAQAADQVRIRDAIFGHTPPGSVVVFNTKAAKKFVNRLYGGRRFAARHKVGPAQIDRMLAAYGEFYVALVDRSGSGVLAGDAADNAAFVALLGERAAAELLYEAPGGRGETARVWRVHPR